MRYLHGCKFRVIIPVKQWDRFPAQCLLNISLYIIVSCLVMSCSLTCSWNSAYTILEVLNWTSQGLEEELRSLPVMQRAMANILDMILMISMICDLRNNLWSGVCQSNTFSFTMLASLALLGKKSARSVARMQFFMFVRTFIRFYIIVFNSFSYLFILIMVQVL